MSLKDKIKIINRNLLEDKRGWFLKIIDGSESNLPQFTGEIYVTCGSKGQSKGGHYHIKANEWFTLISGVCDLILFDLVTYEKLVIKLDSRNPLTIFVPNGIAHIFENTGEKDFILIAYTDKHYDPLDTVQFQFVSNN